jgi:hypothetical protein
MYTRSSQNQVCKGEVLAENGDTSCIRTLMITKGASIRDANGCECNMSRSDA